MGVLRRIRLVDLECQFCQSRIDEPIELKWTGRGGMTLEMGQEPEGTSLEEAEGRIRGSFSSRLLVESMRLIPCSLQTSLNHHEIQIPIRSHPTPIGSPLDVSTKYENIPCRLPNLTSDIYSGARSKNDSQALYSPSLHGSQSA